MQTEIWHTRNIKPNITNDNNMRRSDAKIR
ncbi:MAG: hypothetical protein ACJAWQ_002669, partial [Paraglaciecola sp.]